MRRLFLVLLLTGCAPGFYLKEENDYFKPTKNRDVSYTQGVELGFVPSRGHLHYHLRQLIYTPQSKRTPELSPDDRPYAGYLGVGVTSTNVRPSGYLLSRSLEVGTVGPAAFGAETQRGVHRLLGQGYPQGWGGQLSNEPVVQLSVERLDFLKNGYIKTGGNLGNLFDQVFVGAGIYRGSVDNLVRNAPIFPRARRRTAPQTWVFAEVLGRAVARNLFLDGNTFTESASVERELWVAEARLGVALRFGGWSLAYTYVKQSREYTGEKHGQDFGSITISRPY